MGSRPMGVVSLGRVESSQTRDETRVPCIGRQISFHYATREVPWRTIFPQTRVGRWFWDDSNIYCAIYFYCYYMGSTSDHQALDAGRWGPLGWVNMLPLFPFWPVSCMCSFFFFFLRYNCPATLASGVQDLTFVYMAE